jgi:hypothetical protein
MLCKDTKFPGSQDKADVSSALADSKFNAGAPISLWRTKTYLDLISPAMGAQALLHVTQQALNQVLQHGVQRMLQECPKSAIESGRGGMYRKNK